MLFGKHNEQIVSECNILIEEVGDIEEIVPAPEVSSSTKSVQSHS